MAPDAEGPDPRPGWDERRTQDYMRDGTATLIAAMGSATKGGDGSSAPASSKPGIREISKCHRAATARGSRQTSGDEQLWAPSGAGSEGLVRGPSAVPPTLQTHLGGLVARGGTLVQHPCRRSRSAAVRIVRRNNSSKLLPITSPPKECRPNTVCHIQNRLWNLHQYPAVLSVKRGLTKPGDGRRNCNCAR